MRSRPRTSGQGTSGQGTSGQGTSGQGTSGQGTSGQGTSGQGTSGQGANTKRRPATGRVSLVGAGPGDPDLFTLKGARRLAEADVVLIDALANTALLEHCRHDAEIVDVGKLGYGYQTPQEATCRILIDEAKAGRNVVRLKGGDPFVFGRGAEEVLACAKAGVVVEVVPGISSALAAPAVAGIPVTHRGVARSFTVITGTVKEDLAPRSDRSTTPSPYLEEAKHWAGLASAGGTLVFLMALRPLERILTALKSAGLDPSTPAVMIQSGTTAQARLVEGDLETLGPQVRAAKLASPALLVIGRAGDVRREVLAELQNARPLPVLPRATLPLTTLHQETFATKREPNVFLQSH